MDAHLEQLRWLLEQADRYITGRPRLEVRWAPEGVDIWGYVDDEHVYLNRHVVRGWFIDRPDEAFNLLVGLNFHEIGHLLFTPPTQPFTKRWSSHSNERFQELRYLWNALEDQRIERRLIQAYPCAISSLNDLFTESVEWVADGECVEILVAGRPFLRSFTRGFASASFVGRHGNQAHRKLLGIVNAYVRLGDQQSARMAELIDELHALVNQLGFFGKPENEPAAAIDIGPTVIPLDEYDWTEGDLEFAEPDAEYWDGVAEEWFRIDVRERKRRAA